MGNKLLRMDVWGVNPETHAWEFKKNQSKDNLFTLIHNGWAIYPHEERWAWAVPGSHRTTR